MHPYWPILRRNSLICFATKSTKYAHPPQLRILESMACGRNCRTQPNATARKKLRPCHRLLCLCMYFIFSGCSQAWVGERVAQVVNFQQAVSLNLVARKQVAATALARQKGALLKQLSTSLTAVRQASCKRGHYIGTPGYFKLWIFFFKKCFFLANLRCS